MKRLSLVAVVALALAFGGALPSAAMGRGGFHGGGHPAFHGGFHGGFHHGFHHGHGFVGTGVFIGAPFWWDPWWSGYYYAAPPVVVQQSPPVYVQQPQANGYWYYCQNPQGYYPYVTACPGGWMTVAPPAQ